MIAHGPACDEAPNGLGVGATVIEPTEVVSVGERPHTTIGLLQLQDHGTRKEPMQVNSFIYQQARSLDASQAVR